MAKNHKEPPLAHTHHQSQLRSQSKFFRIKSKMFGFLKTQPTNWIQIHCEHGFMTRALHQKVIVTMETLAAKQFLSRVNNANYFFNSCVQTKFVRWKPTWEEYSTVNGKSNSISECTSKHFFSSLNRNSLWLVHAENHNISETIRLLTAMARSKFTALRGVSLFVLLFNLGHFSLIFSGRWSKNLYFALFIHFLWF